MKKSPKYAPTLPNKLLAIISEFVIKSIKFNCDISKSFFQLKKKDVNDRNSKIDRHKNKSPNTTCAVLFSKLMLSCGYLFFFFLIMRQVMQNQK